MKKAVLIFGVIVIFVVYTMVLRNQHGRAGGTSTTSALASNSSSTTGSSTSGSLTTSSSASTGTATSDYKDGTYTGDSEDAFYGSVQVSATINGGKITTIDFLSFPDDNPNSQSINGQATPLLKQEALKAQSANVDVISGATLTSQAFAKSLQSALAQAKA